MEIAIDGVPGKYRALNCGSVEKNSHVLRKVERYKEKPHIQASGPTNVEQCCENSVYYFQSFAENASIDGLKFLGETQRTIPERIFWAIALLISLVLCIMLVVKTFEKWMSSPVIVSFATSQTSVFEVPFPAVTICPAVKTDRSIFNYTEVYLKVTNNKTLTLDEETKFEYLAMVCDYPDLRNGSETLHPQAMLDFLLTISPSIDFLKLEWRGTEFHKKDLFSPILTSEGICYTFNMLGREELFSQIVYYPQNYFLSNNKSSDWSSEMEYRRSVNADSYPRRTPMAGITGGLAISFIVLKDQLDYACGDALQGFKVAIHHPAEFPRIEERYFLMPLDQSVVASVQPNIMRTSEDLRSYNPQDRKCFFNKEKQLKYFNVYNQQNCLIECLANFTNLHCGCVNFHIPREKSTPVCGAANLDCMEKAKTLFLAEEVDYEIKRRRKSRKNLEEDNTDYSNKCNCLPGCYSLDYDVETSQSDWQWKEVFKVYRESGAYNKAIDAIVGDKSVKLAQATIYFKAMQFLTSERNELYGYAEFWANIGGVVGLFTGFSFVTMFEILYYLSLRLGCNIRLFGSQNWSGSPDL